MNNVEKENGKALRGKLLRAFREDVKFKTRRGLAINADSREVLDRLPSNSVDLVFTSPPFPLLHKKSYGNVRENEYVDWFLEFAEKVYRVLKNTGSFVVDLGSAWLPGKPVRSLYEMKLCLAMAEKLDFHLAQDFYWWNPNKLPTPACWVTVNRERVKDAINRVYWFSKSEHPKASNRNVCQPYTKGTLSYMKRGNNIHKKRPSGHRPSKKFINDNGGSIPPNLLAISNGGSKDYINYCKENNLTVHPARFPYELPEFFIRMLTDPGDLIVDPFGGSCTTGSVAESLDRFWFNVEIKSEYLDGVQGHFLEKSYLRNEVTYNISKPSYKDS